LARPLTREQCRWVADRAGEYWLRWFIAWPPVLWLAVQIGPPAGAVIHLLFTALAGWTLVGVTVAVARTRREQTQLEA
ncbi:hypothetical protein, partial [Ectothiorhodospira sp. PHS-1]|uniref:hypothetical protein n=1 Tax=Ectothiorhodospira sp. PHS-1 TaxID=519989 RepID=UPI000590C094